MDPIVAKKLRTPAARLPVDLRAQIDVSESPASPRISFPYPDLTPPFEVLDAQRAAALLGCDHARTLSAQVDVSSSAEGVCRVTADVWARWNAHAGTHADQPAHWLAEPPFPRFDDAQYQGPALVLDLTEPLSRRSPRAIGRDDLEAACAALSAEVGSTQRLLLRTYDATPDGWDADFAHLAPDAARWLSTLDRLVLVGLDTPSVDAPSASPIHACAHGGLWAGRVAILEGLRLEHVAAGSYTLQVVWSPVQDHLDARGCQAFLYPPSASA